jgi:hypothetical protein
MQSHERAKATAREYRRRKEGEERKAKRKKDEEERNRNGKSRLPVLKGSIQTLWKTARCGTTGYTGASDQPVAKQPQHARHPRHAREEAQRAPPARLTEADRRILPQPYHPQNYPTLPPSRTQTNMGSQGHQTQVPRNQTRTPFAPSTNGPNPNNRWQPERNATGNPNDRLGRFEANQFPSQARTELRQHPIQPVTARRQVAITPPTNIPQPSQARMSRDSQGPPPPVPPKNPWRPQHPQLAPAPLTPRPKESGARLTALRSARQAAPPRSDEIPIGYRPEQQPAGRAPYRTRTIPKEMLAGYRPEPQPPGRAPPHPTSAPPHPTRAPPHPTRAPPHPTRAPPHPTRAMAQRRPPVDSGVSAPFSARAQQGRPQQPRTAPDTVLGYRPNPVFANSQGKRSAGMSAAAASSSSARQYISNSYNNSSSRLQPQTQSQRHPQPHANTNTDTRRPSAVASRSVTAAASRKPAKKRNWFKKLVSPPSSSDSSVEWVSQDAARIERGGLSS